MLKDPDAKLDYSINWSSWLDSVGDTAASATWIVPDGLVKETDPAETLVGGMATVWLSGGTLGQEYEVVCRITTAAGRVDDRVLTITVQNRS